MDEKGGHMFKFMSQTSGKTNKRQSVYTIFNASYTSSTVVLLDVRVITCTRRKQDHVLKFSESNIQRCLHVREQSDMYLESQPGLLITPSLAPLQCSIHTVHTGDLCFIDIYN